MTSAVRADGATTPTTGWTQTEPELLSGTSVLHRWRQHHCRALVTRSLCVGERVTCRWHRARLDAIAWLPSCRCRPDGRHQWRHHRASPPPCHFGTYVLD